MRLVNAVRELRVEHSTDIRTIALHTNAERAAMFVREADEAVCIDEGRPAGAGSPYLDLAVLERALVAARADAAWVGWGFVAERPEFAELCDRLGIVFVGPPARRDAAARRQDRRQAAGRGGRRARGPVERGSGRRPRRRPAPRRRDRLSADDQGDRRRRRSRHPPGRRRGRSGRGLRGRPVGGSQGVRRRHGVHGAGRRRRTPRRGPADRRPPRDGMGRRRARLQHAAAQPEGHRGVAVHRPHRRTGPRPAARPPSAWPRSPGTATPAPSSSSTNRPSAGSRSWRSTPGCRSSTR